MKWQAIRPLAYRAGTALLRSGTVNRAIRVLARLRGHNLVLVYHRVGPAVAPPCEIIPSVAPDVFRAQVQTLAEVVDLVSLEEIVGENGRRQAAHRSRPAVALTFDDDLPSHVEHALPALRDVGVPAAFFLSGRALHGCGPYWFQHLETLLLTHGEERTAALLALPVSGARSIFLACESHAGLRRKVCELARDLPPQDVLGRAAIAALATARMTLGFHTVDHDALTGLDDLALADAVTRGREALSAVAGGPVRYFAYPHGKVDARSAAAVRRAGFDAAFTGRPQPVRPADDRHRLGRWEPGPLAADDLLVKLAVRLHRAAPLPMGELR